MSAEHVRRLARPQQFARGRKTWTSRTLKAHQHRTQAECYDGVPFTRWLPEQIARVYTPEKIRALLEQAESNFRARSQNTQPKRLREPERLPDARTREVRFA